MSAPKVFPFSSSRLTTTSVLVSLTLGSIIVDHWFMPEKFWAWRRIRFYWKQILGKNIYFWLRFIFVYHKSLKQRFLTSFCVLALRIYKGYSEVKSWCKMFELKLSRIQTNDFLYLKEYEMNIKTGITKKLNHRFRVGFQNSTWGMVESRSLLYL